MIAKKRKPTAKKKAVESINVQVGFEINEIFNKHELIGSQRVMAILNYLDIVRIVNGKTAAEFWGKILETVMDAEINEAVNKAKAEGKYE